MPKVTNFLTNSLQGTEKKKKNLHPRHLDPIYSSSCSLWKELCQGLLCQWEESAKRKQGKKKHDVQQQTYIQPNKMKNMMENRSWWMIYPAGLLASLSECCGVVTAESQLASAAAGACTKYQIMWPMSKHEEKKENYTSAESRDLN